MGVTRLGKSTWGPAEYGAAFKGVVNPTAAPRAREALSRALNDLGYPSPLHLVAQGSVALALALEEMKAQRPDRSVVVVPAYCCPSVPNTVRALGLTLRAVPVKPDLNLDIDALPATLKSDVLAVVAVHMYGLPTDMDAIRAHAQSAGAYVIDDAAHVVAPARSTPQLGTKGDVGILSFHHSKTLTGGSPNGGGALIVSNPDLAPGLAERVARLPEGRSRLRNYLWFAVRYGIERTPRALTEYLYPMDERVHGWLRIGGMTRERMSASSSFIVTAQLDRLDDIVANRARIIREYAQLLRQTPELQLVQGATYPTLTRIMVRWRTDADAVAVREKMTRQGFATRLAYPVWPDATDPTAADMKRVTRTHLELPAAPSLQRRHLESVVRSLVSLISG